MNRVSLWRQCRALACPIRLSMLHLLDQEPEQYVKEIAGQLGLAEDVASKNLQLLASAGLLTSERKGKFHHYRLNSADSLLCAIVIEFRSADSDSDKIMRMLTALTHERRVGIVALLKEESRSVGELCRRLKISRRAIVRHLDKLLRRGWLSMENDQCILSQPEESFGKALLTCVVSGGTPAQVCRNNEKIAL